MILAQQIRVSYIAMHYIIAMEDVAFHHINGYGTKFKGNLTNDYYIALQ